MKYQSKIDNMVQILENYKYRVRIISELDWHELFYTFEIYSERQPWLSERFKIKHKKSSEGKYYFYVVLNLHDSNLSMRDTKLMIGFWEEAVELTKHLNNLKIPYIVEYEGDNGLIALVKEAYKKINKRFSVYNLCNE